jgi:hypothetical protein
MSTAGRYMRATVNGVALRGLRSFEPTTSGEELDAADADSAPYEDWDASMYGVRLVIRGIWDPATDGVFPGIYKGAILTNVVLWSNRNNSAPDYSIPEAIVTEESTPVEVKGQIQYTCTIRNKGAYSRFGVLAATLGS